MTRAQQDVVLDLRDALSTVRLPDRPAAGAGRDAFAALYEAELRDALRTGSAERAHEAGRALLRRDPDLQRVHAAVARALDGLPDHGTAHRAATAATSLLVRLRGEAAAPSGSPVVLACPPEDRHVLALEALASHVEQAGFRALVLGGVPLEELQAAARGARAVVLSCHLDGRGPQVAAAAVREAAPQVLLVCGGPAARAVPHADLVTDDPGRLLVALRSAGCPLTVREREVLACVADGLTTAQAATELGIGPATLKSHLDHVFEKTGTTRRGAAVALALREGWI